ncbi:MAG: hypothetical protein AAFP03_11415, partial [Cyanobacteria bacterium J06598_3]
KFKLVQPHEFFFGQFMGASIFVMFLGFLPGYGVSLVLKKIDWLRLSAEEELMGLDQLEFGLSVYPEYTLNHQGNQQNSSLPIAGRNLDLSDVTDGLSQSPS